MKKEEKKKDLRNNARANNRFISDYLLCKVSLEQRYSSIFPCSNISPNDTSKIYLELEIHSLLLSRKRNYLVYRVFKTRARLYRYFRISPLVKKRGNLLAARVREGEKIQRNSDSLEYVRRIRTRILDATT